MIDGKGDFLRLGGEGVGLQGKQNGTVSKEWVIALRITGVINCHIDESKGHKKILNEY